VVNQSVTSALTAEALVAPVKRIVVDTAQALAAAIAEFRRTLSATIARRHCLVERPEPTSLHLFTSLGLQALMSTMLMGWAPESGRLMRWVWMSARSSVRVRMGRTRVMLWIGVRVTLGFRLGFHVDTSRKKSRQVIVYF
jgi:hypothetical protein